MVAQWASRVETQSLGQQNAEMRYAEAALKRVEPPQLSAGKNYLLVYVYNNCTSVVPESYWKLQLLEVFVSVSSARWNIWWV